MLEIALIGMGVTLVGGFIGGYAAGKSVQEEEVASHE